MRNSWLCCFVVLAVLCLMGTDRCDPCGGTHASACLQYSGATSATEPYDEQGETTLQANGGNNLTALAHVKLHNPTDYDATANVSCAFYVASWHAADNHRDGVAVCAHSTVDVEIQWGGEVAAEDTVTAECLTTWR